jgi:thiol-disulfide isomerase/thioredoxin
MSSQRTSSRHRKRRCAWLPVCVMATSRTAGRRAARRSVGCPRLSRGSQLSDMQIITQSIPFALAICHRAVLRAADTSCPPSTTSFCRSSNIAVAAPMSTPVNLHQISSPDHFKALLSEDLDRVSLLYFWAPWAAPCTQMTEVILELAKKYSNLLVLQIEAESQPDITESFDIEAVPSFIILRVRMLLVRRTYIPQLEVQGHTLLGRISGADAAALTSAVATHIRPPSAVNPLSRTDQLPVPASEKIESQAELETRLRSLMNKNKVVLFMKGSPDVPRCGFSRRTVALLREQNVEFSHFDILSDDSVRSGVSWVLIRIGSWY